MMDHDTFIALLDMIGGDGELLALVFDNNMRKTFHDAEKDHFDRDTMIKTINNKKFFVFEEMDLKCKGYDILKGFEDLQAVLIRRKDVELSEYSFGTIVS